MTIHNTEGAWKILDRANFQCEWERTEDRPWEVEERVGKRTA